MLVGLGFRPLSRLPTISCLPAGQMGPLCREGSAPAITPAGAIRELPDCVEHTPSRGTFRAHPAPEGHIKGTREVTPSNAESCREHRANRVMTRANGSD